MSRLEAGTYPTPGGGLLVMKGSSVWWHPEERLDPMTVLGWSNEWPGGDTVRMHLRVWRNWWVRVA